MATAHGPSQETINEFVKAAHGDLAKLEELAEKWPSMLQAKASWNETPLEAAAHTADKEIVEFLISKGVQRDIFSSIVLERAEEVARFLERDPGLARATGAHGIPILFYAAAVGNQKIGQMLLAKGADVDAGAGGNTALHATALFGRLDFARWLLNNGADVNAADYSGKTPLAIALERGHQEVADLLRRQGANA